MSGASTYTHEDQPVCTSGCASKPGSPLLCAICSEKQILESRAAHAAARGRMGQPLCTQPNCAACQERDTKEAARLAREAPLRCYRHGVELCTDTYCKGRADDVPEYFSVPRGIETVNHPAHYGGADSPYEAIKVIDAWQLSFALGNAVKYIARAGKKGSALEDLKKAAWYIAHEIKKLEGK